MPHSGFRTPPNAAPFVSNPDFSEVFPPRVPPPTLSAMTRTNERPKVVVTCPLVGGWREVLEQAGNVEILAPDEGRAGLERAVGDARALVCLLTDRIDRALLDAAPNLRLVANYAVGVDNIDLVAARARGVTVINTPNVLTAATADLAMALLLAVTRRVVEGDALVRAGRFQGWLPDLLLGESLEGRTLGVAGYGRIGRAVARRAAGFGLGVLFWSRRNVTDSPVPARQVSLDELLGASDIVSLHLPLTPETRGLLSADRLDQMKPGAVLINTCRGPVVDEGALAARLATGRLGGAGLDVFEREPAVHPALLTAPNTVLTPHLGSATTATRERMAEALCADVVRVLTGGEARCVVG